MIALLHYAVLKTRRDRSLFLFLFAPLFALAALLGPSLAELRFSYPLSLSRNLTPLQNARTLASLIGAVSIMFGLISAFWTYRAEIATRAIASFVVGSRALMVTASLILFATLMSAAAWLSGIAMAIVLTATVPPHLPLLFAGCVAVSLALNSVSALMVTIAPQPASLIWAYLSMLLFVRWIEKLPDVREFALAAVIFAICTTLSVFFLRRRCAT
jgi:hypothetical protein